jgi:phosphoglycerate dehydrogenase-like enzyme
MKTEPKSLVLSAPFPRTLDLIFDTPARGALRAGYEVLEVEPTDLAKLDDETLARARYILGQPPVSPDTLVRLKSLRCIFNVESNLIDNMPYDTLFQRGIHVVTTGAVFAVPVAELGLAMALNLARGVIGADNDFRQGHEKWGGDGNQAARMISGSNIGIVGYGDLGRALRQVLNGFRCKIQVYDPWLPVSILRDNEVEPASLDQVMTQSDFVFVVAAATTENRNFLGADIFASMRKGASLILLSRADVVDFDALINVVESGHITAASDVFPQEPTPANDPIRQLDGFIRSAHRAGAVDSAFKMMGEMVLEDMALMDKGLPPLRCKRAERETVGRMRSRPVDSN